MCSAGYRAFDEEAGWRMSKRMASHRAASQVCCTGCFLSVTGCSFVGAVVGGIALYWVAVSSCLFVSGQASCQRAQRRSGGGGVTAAQGLSPRSNGLGGVQTWAAPRWKLRRVGSCAVESCWFFAVGLSFLSLASCCTRRRKKKGAPKDAASDRDVTRGKSQVVKPTLGWTRTPRSRRAATSASTVASLRQASLETRAATPACHRHRHHQRWRRGCGRWSGGRA